MRVMIVDDDPWLADLLRQLVLNARPAATVDCFGDAEHALNAWQRSRYQLVLADWNLPDDSGLSLLRRIRQHDGDTPLVMITGRSDRESVLAVRPLAISAYITKPFDVPKVLACIEHLLPADATQPATVASQEDLLAYLGHLSATDLDLPLLARVRDQLKQVCQGVPLDFRELDEAWQHDPALCAYLIAAANSAAYGVAGQVCVGLPEALKRLGGRTSLNLAVALALRQACTEDDTLPSLLLREHLEAAERLADQVVALARQAGIDPAPLQVAALLHRMGELCVLLQSQRWASQGHALDDRVLGRAIGDFARPFAIALKSQWGLPIALRELIGAIYALPQVQFRREQVLMRLAAALCNGEPPANVERLRRLAGLG